MRVGIGVIKSLIIGSAITASLCAAAPSLAQNSPHLLDLVAQAKLNETAKDWRRAADLWQKVTTANPTNGEYWAGLARCDEAVGQEAEAVAAYQRVVDLGDGFPSEAAYRIACCEAKIGDKTAALRWLKWAVEMGFRDIDSVARDSSMAPIADMPEFKKVLGLAPPKGDRTEGWRSDVRYLLQEIKAKGWSPFRKVSEPDFEANAAKLNDDVSTLTDPEIELRLMKLLADVGDGHTSLWGARRPEFAFALPVKFYGFEEGLFVVAAEPTHKDLLGAQVLAIGGQSTKDVYDAMKPYISRDNDQWLKEMIPFRLRSTVFLNALGLTPHDHSAPLKVKKLNGTVAEITLDADMSQPDIWNALPYPQGWVGLEDVGPGPKPAYLRDVRRDYWMEYQANSKTLYVQYNHVQNDPADPIERFAARLNDAIAKDDPVRVVIDMRWNNGGDTLVDDRMLKVLLQNPRLSKRGFLDVIVGRRTFSAAMNAVSYLKRFFDPVLVGEPTGGKPNAPGDEVPFTLPFSGIVVNVSDVYWEGYWPEDHRIWMAPDVYAPPTFADFLAGRDPALNAILGQGAQRG